MESLTQELEKSSLTNGIPAENHQDHPAGAGDGPATAESTKKKNKKKKPAAGKVL